MALTCAACGTGQKSATFSCDALFFQATHIFCDTHFCSTTVQHIFPDRHVPLFEPIKTPVKRPISSEQTLMAGSCSSALASALRGRPSSLRCFVATANYLMSVSKVFVRFINGPDYHSLHVEPGTKCADFLKKFCKLFALDSDAYVFIDDEDKGIMWDDSVVQAGSHYSLAHKQEFHQPAQQTAKPPPSSSTTLSIANPPTSVQAQRDIASNCLAGIAGIGNNIADVVAQRMQQTSSQLGAAPGHTDEEEIDQHKQAQAGAHRRHRILVHTASAQTHQR